MSNYPSGENYPPSQPSTQYSQQGQYAADSYGQSQAGYGANPYGQSQAGYGANPYGQGSYAANPYGQQQQMGYAPVNAYGQPLVYAYVPVINEPGRGQAVAGMVLGIISICLFWDPILGLPLAILGLIFSILGRRSVTRRGMATAGLVLSIITLVFTLSICGLFGAFIFGGGFL